MAEIHKTRALVVGSDLNARKFLDWMPPGTMNDRGTQSRPWLQALSVYMQPPRLQNPRQEATLHPNSAFIFLHKLTEGPKNTSRVIGKARGFIVPIEHSALSAFNIIYLTFDTPEYSGSLGVEAKQAYNWFLPAIEIGLGGSEAKTKSLGPTSCI
ncbi:hypothetical protein COCNU_scaffold016103G000040 [Cocos nucifera]|nr:hypothetical protein [Cocos nucifera]